MSLTITAVVNTAVLDTLLAGILPKTEAAVEATAAAVETDVKINIQTKHIIDTGNLMNSINHSKVGEMTYVVEDGTDYGIYQELGTRRGIVARPFFIPAVEKNTTTLYDKIRQVF